MERFGERFIPENYQIKLFLAKNLGRARGEVEITGVAKNSTVKFHAVNFKIIRVTASEAAPETPEAETGRSTSEPLPVKFTYDGKELIIPDLPVRHPLKISVVYDFKLKTDMQGAYLSRYRVDGEEKLLISTQFESHYARECFPCIDEPAAKATFDLCLATPDISDVVLANTPVKKVQKPIFAKDFFSAPVKLVTFQTTPKMSTYLLAFCLGELHGRAKTSGHGVKVTTYTTKNHPLKSVNYANEVATRALDFYDDKFGLSYPLPKLDQVAIPEFEAGAMENWGLVTYRESCLLVDRTTTRESKKSVTETITHELSHQWFGDLVTMAWWDDLWLNESFATLMSYLCTDALYPEYHFFEHFYTGECRAALFRDALPGVQAVRQPVDSPEEIAALFDASIVYAKGARLMLMLYRLLGERAFWRGLKRYFKRHQYGNTTGDDLWAAVQPDATFDVKKFMESWLSRPGFPLLTDGTQQRFLLGESAPESDEPTGFEPWPIPEVRDDLSGHYLINLSGPEFAEKLANFSNLDIERKIRLILDRSLLARTPTVSAAGLLDLLPQFVSEPNGAVWEILGTAIADLKFFFSPIDPDFPRFQRFLRGIIRPNLDRLGLIPRKDDSDNDLKLRNILTGYALYTEDQAVLATLSELYEEDFVKLNSELRYFILAARFYTTKEADFTAWVERYQNCADPEIKDDLLSVLSATRPANKSELRAAHGAELVKLLDKPKIILPQDRLFLFVDLARNFYTHDLAADWLYQNWSKIVKTAGEKSCNDYPRYLASTLRKTEELDEFLAFFAAVPVSAALARTLAVGEAEARANLARLERDAKAVRARLNELT